MKIDLSDTDPEAERVQKALVREASPARRYALVRSLSRTRIQASRDSIRKRMPGAGDEAVCLRWVELAYGEDLASEFLADLERRRR